MATTTIKLFNATEMPLTFHRSHNWIGQNGTPSYPTRIPVGSWGTFQHVGNQSVGAVVFRGENAVRVQFDWLISWDNRSQTLKVYSEVRGPGHHDGGNLSTVSSKLGNSGVWNKDKYFNVVSTVTIGNDPSDATSALLVGIITPESAYIN